MVNETEPEKERLQNSRDYKEITLVITILAGISAFLLKLIDYFNNNTIVFSDHVQFIIYLIVYVALIEISLVFSFLILKGCLLTINRENERLKLFTNKILLTIFTFPIPLIFILISTLFFYAYFIEENYYNNLLIFIYYALIVIFAFSIYFYLNPALIHSLKDLSTGKIQIKLKIDLEDVNYNSLILKIISIPIITFIFISLLIMPSYLLVGHYSIEVFPESNNDGDMLTFTIEETGITYARCYVTLYKLNSSNKSLEYVDNITIPIQLESKNKLIFGGIHELKYYLNINTSTLSPGNYMLHAEVTNEISKIYDFGAIKKHDDKLFYIGLKNTNISS